MQPHTRFLAIYICSVAIGCGEGGPRTTTTIQPAASASSSSRAASPAPTGSGGIGNEAPVANPAVATAPDTNSDSTSIAPSGGTGGGGTATADESGMTTAGGVAAEASPFPASVTRPQIMIVGDSISAGPGCYKKYLLNELNSNGYTNFDFVGEYTDDCGGGVRHSARSCSTAEQYTQPTFTLAAGSCNPSGTFPGLTQLVAKYPTDLLMIQLGVNDAWGGRGTDAILASYGTLVQQARAQNPNVVIAIAQIQQIRPTPDGDAVFARAEQLINAIPAWAQAQSQPQSPVFVADLWTNSDTAQTLDGVHPDDAGAQRMGLNWFATLSHILRHD